MAERFSTVSLLTDYGLTDEFVGVVKAVIRDIAPHVHVVDLTHGIEPYDVRAGALALARCIQYVPSGVIVAVVDPGVGTARRPVAIEVAGGDGVLVGPDNGLLAPAVAMAGGAERAVVLDNPAYRLEAPGATFAGRDVFAPAAAHLCNGVDLAELGTPVDPDTLLPGVIPLPRDEGDEVACEILWVDRYGNAQLNLGPEDLPPATERVLVRTRDTVRAARCVRAFGELAPGQLGLVTDSYGLLALTLDRASAAHELGLASGDPVWVKDASGSEGEGGPAAGGLTIPVADPVRVRLRP